jgi:hypothetical protein
MKAKTLLVGHDLKNKVGEGDGVVCIQADKEGNQIMTNMDWSFDSSWTPTEIKSMLGGFLGSIEEVFGEKMVTEAIIHWADDTGKTVMDKNGKFLWLRSKGLQFRKGGE